MSIPGRIIQTGKRRELEPFARASAANVRLLHPEWDYRFFDDDAVRRFVAEEFPQYRALFDAFPRHIQRVDFFRYLAVYRLGGFYFDLDVFLYERLAPLQSAGCVFPFEELTLNHLLWHRHGMDWEVGNYAFGAAPGHPFLKAIIENCVRAQRDPRWLGAMMAGIPKPFRSEFLVLNSTGPGLVSRTLAENPALAGGVTVLFPEDVRDPSHWHQFGTHGVHLMQGSWRSKGGWLRRRLAWWWEARARRALMSATHHLGPSRWVNAVAAVAGPVKGGGGRLESQAGTAECRL